MLNFAEQTGSGAVMIVWPILKSDVFSCYKFTVSVFFSHILVSLWAALCQKP
jgi:hypothetical protein